SFAARKRSYDVPAAAYGNDQDHRFAKMTMLERRNWRMPPLNRLPALHMTLMTKVWMGVLRGYLLIAVALIGFKVFVAATGVEVSIPQIGGTPTSNDAATSNTGSK
ncbi:MAG: manganese transporter, partial [Bradyrhizobium sp.]|nr:manganese transporter [Bradyrhizobium sp.]